MSKTRIIVRVLMVLLLLGMCWLGYRSWARSQPDFYLDRAEAAASAGDTDTAIIFLRKQVEKEPENAAAHRRLAELYLAAGESADRRATYQTHPVALNHLAEAARLDTSNTELQLELVSIFLSLNQMQRAAGVASRVVDAEPNHGEVLFALAWQAVDSKNGHKAEELFERLSQVATPHAFKILALIIQHHEEQGTEKDIQKSLDEACQVAGSLAADHLRSLSRSDLNTLPKILFVAVLRAESVSVAHRRCDQALTALETLAQAELRSAADLGDQASRLMLVLDNKHPITPEAYAEKPQRARLEERGERLMSAAVEADDAGPLVYRQLAVIQFNRGDGEAAMATLNQGLAKKDEVPEDRQSEYLDLQLLAARRLVMAGEFAEAEPHVGALLEHELTEGWGHLLAGGVALEEGRLEKARHHFLQAQKLLGNTLLVRMALGTTHLQLGQYADALPLLDSLHIHFERLDEEQTVWAERHLGTGAKVHFVQLQAQLGLDQWDKAQRHVQALRETEFETRAYALAVQFLWTHNRPEPAKALLVDVRRRFPGDLALFRLQISMLQEMGQTASVVPAIESFAAATPDNADSQLMLCQLRLQQGRAEEALQRLEVLQQRFSYQPEQRRRILVEKARALLVLDRPQEALALIEPLRDEPRSAAAAGMIGMAAQLQQRDVDGAARELELARETNPGSGVLGFLQGQLAAASGDYDAAIAPLESSLDVTGLRDRAKTALVRSLLAMAQQEGRAEEAEQKLDALRVKYPRDEIFLLAKAQLAFGRNEFEVGMQHLDEYERLDPMSPRGAYYKTMAWIKAENPQRALKELDRALAIKPDDISSRMLAIKICLDAQLNTAAVQHAQAVLARDPDVWQAVLLQAEALRRLVRHDEAHQLLETLTQQKPRLPAGYLVLGSFYARAEKFKEALQTYERGRQQLPDDTTLLSAEIALLIRFEQLEAAEALARRAAGSKPDWQKTMVLSQAFLAAGQEEQAAHWGRQALAQADDKQRTVTHLHLGNIALNQSKQDENPDRLTDARDHFAAVIESNPAHFLAGNNLAWLLATEFNQPADAVRVAENVRGGAPVRNLPVAFIDTLAVAYRKAKRLEDAQQVLEEALDANPQQSQLMFQLGLVLVERQEAGEARKMLEQALQLGLAAPAAEEAKRQLAALVKNS